MVFTRAQGVGIREMLVKGYNLVSRRYISYGALMYSIVIIVNNTVLYTKKIKEERKKREK